MFNKLKQYKDLRNQAKILQNVLAGETVTVEKNGLKVVVNGNLEIGQILLNPDLSKDRQESLLIDCLNEAIKKCQKIMASKAQELGGFQGFN